MKQGIIYIATLVGALILGVGSVSAQEDINKSIEVTKAYVPTINGATKLVIRPRMDDTVRLRPDIDYQIKPVACYTTFASKQISPAQIKASPYTTNNRGFVSFSMGYPFQTSFDLYLNNRENSKRILGGYINHRGSFGKRRSDLDTLQNALSLYNGAGFYGAQRWNNLTLKGEVGYNNRVLHRYGAFIPAALSGTAIDTLSLLPDSKQSLVDYGKAFGNIYFGDDFSELSRLNFGIGLNTAYSYDLRGSEMVTLDADGRIAQMFGYHGFDVGVDYRSYYGIAHLAQHGNQSFAVRPRYLFRKNNIRLGVGLDYAFSHDKAFGTTEHNVFPHLDFAINLLDGYLIPYASASGDHIDGSFEALSRENPFIAARTVAPTGSQIQAEVGLTGSALQSISYKLYFNFTHFDNMYHFVALYKPQGSEFADSFGVITDNAQRYTVGAEIEYLYAGKLGAKLNAHYYGYNAKYLPTKSGGGSMPSYDVGVALEYRHKEKFIIGASAKVLGARTFYEMVGATSTTMAAQDVASSILLNKVPACVDLGIHFDIRLHKEWWFYIQGSNLANSKLYTYNHYRSLGANIRMGLKTTF